MDGYKDMSSSVEARGIIKAFCIRSGAGQCLHVHQCMRHKGPSLDNVHCDNQMYTSVIRIWLNRGSFNATDVKSHNNAAFCDIRQDLKLLWGVGCCSPEMSAQT